MKNKIIVLTNKPQEEYQALCHKLIKRYCFINNYNLEIVDGYKYNKNYDYIIYIDNSTLLLDLNTKIEDYIEEEFVYKDLINSLRIIRNGGYITGDDVFFKNDNGVYTVKKALEQFVKKYNVECTVDEGQYVIKIIK